MFEKLTTAAVPEKYSLDYWQMVCSELIGSIELRDYVSESFQAEFELTQVGGVKIGKFDSVTQTLERKASSIKPSDIDDFVIVFGNTAHAINFEHNDRCWSGSGGIFLLDVTKPYLTSYPGELHVLDVFIPRKKLIDVLGPARLAAGLCIESTQSSYALISGFLSSLATHGRSLDPVVADRMSAIAIDLIAAGIAENHGQCPSQKIRQSLDTIPR